MIQKIFIGADHAGFALKEHLKKYFIKKNVLFMDIGARTFDPTDDYPDIAFELAKNVTETNYAKGILLCGSGQGVCIAANKIKGIRAALSWNEKSAFTSRNDDDANILCLPSKFLKNDQAERIVHTWLKTPFSSHVRHKRRVKKITKKENSLLRK